jgi:hypothetical protein
MTTSTVCTVPIIHVDKLSLPEPVVSDTFTWKDVESDRLSQESFMLICWLQHHRANRVHYIFLDPSPTLFHPERRERPREEMLREMWNLGEGGPVCTEQVARTVNSVLRSDAVQNILCWLASFVHNGPPSPRGGGFKSSPASSGKQRTGPSSMYKEVLVYATEYTECWPGQLFDILYNKYFPAG